VETAQVRPGSKGAEWVEIAPPDLSPVDELDTQLVAGLRLSHEPGFVEADHGVELPDRRHRRLAHADDADLGRLDQRDAGGRADGPLQGRGGHPAGRAAANDHDLPDRPVHTTSIGDHPRRRTPLSARGRVCKFPQTKRKARTCYIVSPPPAPTFVGPNPVSMWALFAV